MKKITTSPWYRVERFVKAKLTTDIKDIWVSFVPTCKYVMCSHICKWHIWKHNVPLEENLVQGTASSPLESVLLYLCLYKCSHCSQCYLFQRSVRAARGLPAAPGNVPRLVLTTRLTKPPYCVVRRRYLRLCLRSTSMWCIRAKADLRVLSSPMYL